MFEFGTFVVSILGFLIMYWVIRTYGFKPLGNMLEQRSLFVQGQINEAEQTRIQAEQHLNEQRQLLDEAKHQAKDLLESARVRADEQAREIVAAAQVEAARVLEEGRELIHRERTEVLNEVLAKVSGLTVEISEKLLRQHVTAQVHEEMVAEAEQRLGELVC